MESIAWLEEIYCARETDHSKFLHMVYDHVETVFARAAKQQPPESYNTLQTANEILKQANIKQLPTIFIIAFLRVTFRARRALPNWIPFRDQAINELRERNEQAEMLLTGLIDTSWDDKRWHT